MKKLSVFLAVAFLCLLLIACNAVRQREPFSPSITDRTAAVVDILQTQRSKIEVTQTSATTQPQYYEVVATGTTAASTEKLPVVTEAPKEYFTVKFVDTDGYTAISVQTVIEGGSAVAPAMPNTRGDLVFRGWDTDFTNINRGTVVKAIYQKEWLTVRFFDADASLLKTEQVRYGESATPPQVTDKDGYLFDGWNTLFDNVTQDLDVYATYYTVPVREKVTLPQLYTICTVEENTQNHPQNAYYRKLYENVLTINSEDYGGNILYGNFSDELHIGGFGFTDFEGIIALKGLPEGTAESVVLRAYIYVDDREVFSVELTRPGAYKSFKVDLTGAETLTVRLEPLVDNFFYYTDAKFIGGLVDAAVYKD